MHDGGGATNPVKIFANIFISFVGAGGLGLPFAFKEVKTQTQSHWDGGIGGNECFTSQLMVQ